MSFADVLALHGPDFELTLEEYFTQIEAMLSIVGDSTSLSGKYTASVLDAMRTRLLVGLSAVLEESADVAKKQSPARKKPCAYHGSRGGTPPSEAHC